MQREKNINDKRMIKEIKSKKPLFQLYEEKYQENFIARDLEEQKAILNTKRSMQN